uniref:Uncharacterized protein n=1 Tax=Hucho hucho TaxID=62062 RepID=A0A4W5PS26_9TELE
MLNVSIQEEVHAKSRLLENTQGKVGHIFMQKKCQINDLSTKMHVPELHLSCICIAFADSVNTLCTVTDLSLYGHFKWCSPDVMPQLKVAKLEIQDLQAEFELERNDYLATIRRQVGEGQLLQSLLERMAPLVRRDCNYSNLDRLRKEATWDDDSVTWRLPDVLVQKTALPSAVAASAQRLSVCMSSAADTGESFQQFTQHPRGMVRFT